MFHFIDEATSSNDIARDARYAEGDIVCVERQTAGRGQRGHSWSGCEGLDLTFSLVLCPTFLHVSGQFDISRITALATVATLGRYGIGARIKWTNDIYVGDRKITGVLIENRLEGDRLAHMVVGVGLNVNRREFDTSLPNPTSMALETGCEFDRREVLETFHREVRALYDELKSHGAADIRRRYDSQLYRLGEKHLYALPDGTRFEASICGTEPSGRLVLELAEGGRRSFAFRETEFVLKK